MSNLYDKNRRPWNLEPYYSAHIAAELAFRDMQITRLRAALVSARGEIARMATDGGGFSCAVIDDIDAALVCKPE